MKAPLVPPSPEGFGFPAGRGRSEGFLYLEERAGGWPQGNASKPRELVKQFYQLIGKLGKTFLSPSLEGAVATACAAHPAVRRTRRRGGGKGKRKSAR